MACSIAVDNCYIKLVTTQGNWRLGSSGKQCGTCLRVTSVREWGARVFIQQLAVHRWFRSAYGAWSLQHFVFSAQWPSMLPVARDLYIVIVSRLQHMAVNTRESGQGTDRICYSVWPSVFFRDFFSVWSARLNFCCLHPGTLTDECVSPFQSFLATSWPGPSLSHNLNSAGSQADWLYTLLPSLTGRALPTRWSPSGL